MAVTFDQARQSVEARWPDYDIAPYGYETDTHWLLIPTPVTVGGRLPAVTKASGSVTWINENSDLYSQERRVGDWP